MVLLDNEVGFFFMDGMVVGMSFYDLGGVGFCLLIKFVLSGFWVFFID